MSTSEIIGQDVEDWYDIANQLMDKDTNLEWEKARELAALILVAKRIRLSVPEV